MVRRGTPPLSGTWSLPGGRIEAGESARDAVMREVLEETGLAVRAGALVDIVRIEHEGRGYVIHEYVCEAVDSSQTPRAASDAADARWVAEGDLEAIGATPEVRDIVGRARAMHRS